MNHSLHNFYCKPGVSSTNKTKLGLIAVRKIVPNTKVLNKAYYQGGWQCTKHLYDNDIDYKVIYEMQEIFKNKRMFLQNSNREYTFVPDMPIYSFHAELFLNDSKQGNIICKSDGFYSIDEIDPGEELTLRIC